MKTFVAIIGSRDAGKSTVIKSLTGCENNSSRGFIQDNLNSQSIYVSCGSPQERPKDLENLRKLAALLKQILATANCRGVVMAIQPSRPNTRLSMEAILIEAQKQKFAVYAYVLDPEHAGYTGTLASVSQRLHSLGIQPTALDARRFAHVNSTIINTATRIAA